MDATVKCFWTNSAAFISELAAQAAVGQPFNISFASVGPDNITNFESYGGLLSKNINGKYKYTFKMDPPYNLYLYSIERIK